MLNVQFHRSDDGGKTFAKKIKVPHGDNHDLWIAADNNQRMIEANDGGANVSVNGGESWTDTGRLARLVEEIASRYPVDRSRIYLVGYSMGAGGVWRVAVNYPSLFAAAAPTAAWTPEPSPAISGALRDVPIRIDHGTADEVAPYARAELMAEALAEAGVAVTLETYEGADHGELTRIYS